ncbi:hypothetical protein BDZ90DRAFT_231371 [Jaminaea rosea]|uniref:RRM domain-containing protein n=1 Tax=Jaminaea rosea TaxID=1569628 RepID=A0A316USX4_9BASI|nr:hypothetical protein BDZ90DRAFT_231371 [Jaminaea rosea]PWN28380.1 hypothetical protein BDZ90DRAFT_231371 [Jaminaea rosea]
MSSSERQTDAFLSSIERDARGGSTRSSRRDGGDRDYDRDRSSRRSYRDDPDVDRHRIDDDRDRSSRRRRARDDEDDDYYSSSKSSRRRRDDPPAAEDYYHRGAGRGYYPEQDDPYASRRRYDDPYNGYGGYAGGYGAGHGGRHYDAYGDGGRGGSRGRGSGGGDWRTAAEPSPARMRSPTPEGTRPISERKRKNSKWGITAQGFENISAMEAKSTGLFGIPGQSRTLGVQGQSNIPHTGGHGVGGHGDLPPIRFGGAEALAMGVAGASSSVPQVGSGMSSSNRQSRRLYVGNLPYGVTEASFAQFWNERMRQMNFQLSDQGEPCVSTQVNSEKGYAFVEFRCPEEATNAMSFDGVIYNGQALKIRRPKDYAGPDVGPPPSLHVPGVISTNVPDGPNKIYVGGLPTYLNEDQVIELLKAFGELRAFNLVREANNGPSKGFAFCEYVDPSLTDLACQGLNDMELGDRKLVVQPAQSGQRGTGQSTGGMTGANAGALGVRSFALPTAGEGGGEPTACMTMLNMVTPEELVDDVEYGEIVEDVRDECAKYGEVLDVRIPRPVAQSKGSSAQAWKASITSAPPPAEEAGKEREGVGRVYVRFAETSQCESALKAIAGRQFGGRLVICAFLSPNDWPGEEDGGENAEATQQQQAQPASAA